MNISKDLAVLPASNSVEVEDLKGNKKDIQHKNIILATGARSKELPNLKQDGKKIIGYREAMTLEKLPESMVVVGSGAIGSEFANFYQSMGTKVHWLSSFPGLFRMRMKRCQNSLKDHSKK